MHREVLDAMDHSLSKQGSPEFFTRIPTTENLAIAIWQRLESKLQKAKTSPRPRLRNPDLFVDFYGRSEGQKPTAKMLRADYESPSNRRYLFSASQPLHSAGNVRRKNRVTYVNATIHTDTDTTIPWKSPSADRSTKSTGMVCNLVDLDGFVQSEVLSATTWRI